MSSPIETAWGELYAVQTEAKGVAILATVGAFAVNKPAILEAVQLDSIFAPDGGGIGQAGGYLIQMRQSDFSGGTEPPKQTAVTCNGAATNATRLEVFGVDNRDGIFYIVVADYSTKQ